MESKIGNLNLEKWYLFFTSDFNDEWRKFLLDEYNYADNHSYIGITRVPLTTPSKFDSFLNIPCREYKYQIAFIGKLFFLNDYYKLYNPIYSNCLTELTFSSIIEAKEHIDYFIIKMNKLMIFT